MVVDLELSLVWFRFCSVTHIEKSIDLGLTGMKKSSCFPDCFSIILGSVYCLLETLACSLQDMFICFFRKALNLASASPMQCPM
jgi:hypothetical protein